MLHHLRLLASAAMITTVSLLHVTHAHAQAYPQLKPVTLIVPFAAGSATDALGRVLADGLSQAMGQKVIVENRAGAGGAIAFQSLAKSAPDGYTIALGSTSINVLAVALELKLPYDVIADFIPVALPADLPYVLASATHRPPRSMREFLAFAKSNPTQFVTAGPGTGSHLLGAAVLQIAGGRGDAVHYKSAASGLPDLLAGRLDFVADAPAMVTPHIKGGRLVGLGVFADQRLSILPDVPTMTESWPDAPDFMKRASVYILTVPAKTPREVVNRINADLTRTVADPVIKERIERLGMLPRPPMDVDQVAAHLRQTTEDWKRVVQNSNIREALKATTN
jgi:tripartite-type tricarboxylate transporter receptor subunit TctC